MDPYLWNLQSQYSTIDQPAETRSNKSTDAEQEVRQLRSQVDRLTLACQSLWELLRDAGQFSEDELKSKIAEVDLRDGAPDGKLGSTVLTCPACGRNTNSRRQTCLWCGGPIEREHIFEG